MYQPFDKFISNIDGAKVISQKANVIVKQVTVKENDENYNMIEFNINDQIQYINLLNILKRLNYNQIHSQEILKIKVWSYDIKVKDNISNYTFFFITDYFEHDFNTLILKKQQTKQMIDPQIIFKITGSLAELFKKMQSKQNLNPINKFNIYLYEGQKAKYVPQSYFQDLCQQKLQTQDLIKMEKLSPRRNRTQLLSPRGFGVQTPRFTLEPIPAPVKKSNFSTLRKTMSTSRVHFNLQQVNEQKRLYNLPSYKTEQNLQENRVYNYGVLLFELSTLQDTNQKNNKKFTEILDEIDQKYGKLYMNFLKEILDGDLKKWDQVVNRLKTIGKFKQSDDDHEEDQKKSAMKIKKSMNQTTNLQNELNIKQMSNNNLASGYKYLQYFPDEKNCAILVNITNIFNIFYEIVQLEMDKPMPKQIQSVSLPAINEYKIFLFGGVFSNQVFQFDCNSRTLIQKKRMLSVDRTHFATCQLQAKLIFIIGGKIEGQTTNQCDLYDCQNDEWKKLKEMNNAVSDCCVCNYNDQFIYRFGGITESKKICQDVEQYDIIKNQWKIIKIIQHSKQPVQFLKQSQCIILNEIQILIFGGKNEDNQIQQSNIFFNIFETGLNTIFEIEKTDFRLPQPWSLINSTVLDERGIFALQNGGNANKNTLKVIFSGINEWRVIKNVIY